MLAQQPCHGLRVTYLPTGTILDIANVRMALDLEAVTWHRYRRGAFDPDPMTQHEGHVAFHQGIWAASENTMLLRLWPVVEAHLTILVAQDQVTRADPERAFRVDERLIDAIKTGEMDAVRAAFTAHTMDSARELIEIIENEGKTG